MKRIASLVVVLTTIATTACLQKDTTSTIYLNQDGTASWMVLERNVRSDEDDAAALNREEHEYLDSIVGDRHRVAEAFKALGALDVRTRLLRDERPYAAMVDGRFAGLTDILAPVFTSCGMTYDAALATVDGVTTWTLRADIGLDGDAAFPDTCAKEFEGLLDAAEVTVVVTRGRFTNAVGFTLEGADRAVFDEKANNDEALARNNGRMVLSLSWTADRS